MAELTDLENNLDPGPAPEDNLVEFAASTVYEDDYIMLSDIIPTESDRQPELPSSFDDLMIGGEEVSTSDYIDTTEINQNGCNDLYGNVTGETSITAFESIPQQQPKKRGRKRKEPVSTSVPTTSLNVSQPDDIKPKRTSKRGRKPKNYYLDPEYQESNKSITSTNGDHQKPTKKVGRKNTRKGSLNDSEVNTVAKADMGSSKKSATKRGRPKGKTINSENPTNSVESTSVTSQSYNKNCDDDDDEGDVVLSQLKKKCTSEDVTEPEGTISSTDIDSTNKLDPRSIDQEIAPIPSDFEYIKDNVIAETPNVVVESVFDQKLVLRPEAVGSSLDEKLNGHEESVNTSNIDSLLVEDSTKRPQRRKAKRQPKYELDSDEDPFANCSDDDYVPGKSVKSEDDNDFSGMDDEEYSDSDKPKRKRGRKISQVGSVNRSPGKKGRPPKVTTVNPDSAPDTLDDIEQCLQSSVIKGDKSILLPGSPENSNSGKKATEFENFLAHRTSLQIKKVSKSQTTPNVPTLDIPTIDPTQAKKCIEVASQTKAVRLSAVGVQTSSPYAIKVSQNIELSQLQAENACEFLKGILKTTSELGTLMTQKSEEFIEKKINTSHVKDTMKVDYCIKKAFLLFKLAKDNLTTMEQNLEKEYEEFLRKNDLSLAIETEKKIAPKKPEPSSDSDCEIVDDPEASNMPTKPKFNPKTVFLNKELSIKIAKKTPDNAKVKNETQRAIVKGPHAVWLNDSIMVKKVNPSPSFLAQDGRNKKPPDNKVTEQMLDQFFRNYYRQQVLTVCEPYISPQWLQVNTDVICNYFIVNKDEETPSNCLAEQELLSPSTMEEDTIGHDEKHDFFGGGVAMQGLQSAPRTLSSLCTDALQKHMFVVDREDHPDRVDSLLKLCVNRVHSIFFPDIDCRSSEASGCDNNNKYLEKIGNLNHDVSTLKAMCFQKVSDLLKINYEEISDDRDDIDNVIFEITTPAILTNVRSLQHDEHDDTQDSRHKPSAVKHATRDYINKTWLRINAGYFPKSLQNISLSYIRRLMFRDLIQASCENKPLIKCVSGEEKKVSSLFKLCSQVISKYFGLQEHNRDNGESHINALTIDNVNTLTEEDFCNLEENSNDTHYEEEAFVNDDEFDDFHNDDQAEDDNWESQVVLRELKSGIISNIANNALETEESLLNATEEPVPVRIKQEPLEEQHPEYNSHQVNIKTEPVENHLGMVNIPNHIHEELSNIAKNERPDYIENATDALRPNPIEIANYDVETFEAFVRSNKMMHAVGDIKNSEEDPIFSQSALRARVQYEPDSDNEYDNNDNLDLFLISRDSEPINPVTAKGNLMESSSDDGTSDKQKSDKKLDKRKRGKHRRPPKNTEKNKAKEKPVIQEVVETKKSKDKSLNMIPDEKAKPKETPMISEIAVLTRRMREKIRNEQQKNDSSNSESEDLSTLSKKKNKALESDKEADMPISQKKDKGKSSKKNKIIEDDIQCNNVDSTEQIAENTEVLPTKQKEVEDVFSGFTNNDQNDAYQKKLKDIYDRILPTLDEPSTENDVNADVDAYSDRSHSPLMMNDEEAEELECEPTMPIFDEKTKAPRKAKAKPKSKVTSIDAGEKQKLPPENVDTNCVDRHGWKCYPTDGKDPKLYLVPYVPLVKLPEEFVDVYFKYQQVSGICEEDAEVDRLANLQSLHRGTKEISAKDPKCGRVKQRDGQKATTDSEVDRPSSETGDYNELAPSDDEGAHVDDELPPPVPTKSSENFLAKNSLMDDIDSDAEADETKKIKKEHYSPESASKQHNKAPEKLVKVFKNTEDLVLTADKMMRKELAILHAPVLTIDDDGAEKKYSPPKEAKGEPKHKEKSTRIYSKRERTRSDDSSSEEEKQWVSTKEKLLKRMEKKTAEDTIVDDAKRAKLVTEFIERRDTAPAQPRKPAMRKTRRSRKKFLERQKQMKFLNNALFADAAAYRKTGAQSYSKGRRNIRKVIDKKSLARSTVIANMEEFERKRRLIMKQMRLRELLGYDEGVNVLVINGEVCLEYDFEELQPIVTVHPFFTKVMKAHQYEGVKFMWDACFESLAQVDSGHGGGGCILAHCMGLGKTLQVLALLHTVLTHPRVGMQRVLVCCPLSTVLNWVDEIHKWLGPVTNQIKVFELSKLKKTYERAYQLEDWYNGGGIFIVGYELFRSLTTLDPQYDDIRPTIIKKITSALLDPGPDIVVCDEGHLLKNDSSVLAIAMSRVRTKRRIVLTGTPMQNNLREYYCMLNFVKPNLLGTYSEYSNRFENPIMNGQHRDSSEEDIKLMKQRTHILHKVLEGCLQRQEAAVLYPYLPKKHEYTLFISLSPCQADLYKKYLAHCVAIGKQSLLKDYNILQKIWSHPQVLHHFGMRQRDAKAIKDEEKLEDDLAREDLTATEDTKPPDTDIWWLEHLGGGSVLDSLQSSNKFVTVFEILKECVALDDKLLIFSTSLFTLDALEYFLKKINGWSLGQEYYRLDGSVPPEVRQKWCREFNAEANRKTKLFLISTRAGCLGLNMTAANRVIILDTSWNPAHDIQSIFRVYRFGQKKDCYIYRLVAMGTMEQKIYERGVTKQAVSCRVIDEQQIDRHYDIGELKALYRFDELGEGVAGGVAGGVRDVVLLRVARETNVHAVHEHDSLLRDTREQELPEHERAAAWHQFQVEQANKQIQNQLYAPGHYAGPTMTIHPLSVSAGPAPRPPPPPPPPPLPPLPPLVPRNRDIKQEELPERRQQFVKPMVRIEFTPNVPADPDFNPKAGPQPRRRAIQCNIPIGPNSPEEILPTPVTIIPDSSDPNTVDMVKRIAEALKKHKFNTVGEKGSLEPAEVAKVVSNIISNVNNTSADATSSYEADDLLVPSTSKAPEPASLDGEERRRRGRPRKVVPERKIVPERKVVPERKIEGSPAKRGRGRPRKCMYEEAETDVTQKVPEFEARTDILPDGSKRRAAVSAAEKNLDAVINIDSDDECTDSGSQSNDFDYVPDDEDTRDADEIIAPAERVPDTETRNPKQPDDSIVLSDEETPPTIPLHASLLTNKNFIKIVAHTYLKGNPMLDIDAATLAAEYSTSKALKEFQSTGQQIVSGPIYDIATKVLGIEVLKKLNTTDARKPKEPKDVKPNVADLNTSETAPKGKMAAVPKLTIKSEASLREPAPASGARASPVPTSGVRTGPAPESGARVGPVSVTRARAGPSGARAGPSGVRAGPVPTSGVRAGPAPESGARVGPVSVTRARAVPASVPGARVGPVPALGARASPAHEPGARAGPAHEPGARAGPAHELGARAGPAHEPGARIGPSHEPGARAGPVPVMMSSAGQSAALPKNVVPVGMSFNTIARAAAAAAAEPDVEECILPDDDVRPAPAPAPAPPRASLVNLLQKHRGKKMMQLTKVTSKPSVLPYNAVPVAFKDVPVNARVIKLTKTAPTPAAQESISLDSDEEDPPLAPPPQPPVMVITRNSANKQQFFTLSSLEQTSPQMSAAAGPRIVSMSGPAMQTVAASQPQIVAASQPQIVAMSGPGPGMLAGIPQILSVSGSQAQPRVVSVGEMQASMAPATKQNIINLNNAQLSQLQPMLNSNYVLLPTSALDNLTISNNTIQSTAANAPPIASSASVLTHSTPIEPESRRPGRGRPLKAIKSTAKAQGPVAIAPKPAPPPPAVAEKPRPVRVRAVTSSSSSGSSRSASPAREPAADPADPLSCLRDVVHIQAPATTHSKIGSSTLTKKHSKYKPSKHLNTPKPASSDFFRSSSPPASVSKTKPKATYQNKHKGKTDDSKQKLLGSFDLTDVASDSKPKPSPASKKPGPASSKSGPASSKPGPSSAKLPDKKTVVGSSKDIIIGGKQSASGKPSSVLQTKITVPAKAVQGTGNNRVIHITNVQTIAAPPSAAPAKPAPFKPATVKIEGKRKAAAPVPQPPLKKKPMTLEDFSLDDMEDIIELE